MKNFTGRQIDRYRITERLGMGGMAVVYKAYDTRLERDVALKLIRTEAIPAEQHERLIRRFEREAHAMAKLLHPNIVQVLDFGDFEGVPYLVMPYLSGGTLKEYTGKPMNYRRAAGLLAPIADALVSAHEQGIIHRDVKPANILITQSGTPMLSDFGIAKLLESQDLTLTSTGFGVGTPQYMAPEQWRNEVCPQTDIYALGTIFYELITGQKPYDAETPAAIAVKQATEPIIHPRTFISDLPESVEKVIYKALAFKPENRYFVMQDFGSALLQISRGRVQEVRESLSTVSIEDEVTYDTLGEGTTVDQLTPPQADQERPPFSTREPKKGWPVTLMVAIIVLVFIGLVFGITRWAGQFTPREAPHSSISENDVAVNPDNVNAFTQVEAPTQLSTVFATAVSTFTSVPKAATITSTSAQSLGVGAEYTRTADEMLIMFVPEGNFIMGSGGSDPNASAHEKPQHEVYLDAFWMDIYEVSNAQFTKFVEETGHLTQAEHQGYSFMYDSSGGWGEFEGVNWRHPNGVDSVAEDALPVVHVNYYDASAYCQWAGARLPTEAEWEKAARGDDGRTYPWGNSFNAAYVRYDATSGPVNVYNYPEGKSPYGIYNMAGNAFEWTQDWYGADYYSVSPRENPTGPSNGEWIVLRGGSWNNSQKNIRTMHRDISGPDYMNYLLGFRCVMDAE